MNMGSFLLGILVFAGVQLLCCMGIVVFLMLKKED
jgi:hypothetical protein